MKKHIPIICVCSALPVLIFGSLNWQALYDTVVVRKSTIVLTAIIFTFISAAIELTILARRDPPFNGEEIAGAVAKGFAALALIATVLSSAEDLSGKNDKAAAALNTPHR